MQGQILDVATFLEPGSVLLKRVGTHRVNQVEREIGVQVEQRTAEEAVHLESVPACKRLAVVGRERTQFHASTVRGIDVAEAVQQTSVDQILRELAGRREVVAAENEAQADLPAVVEGA